MRIEWNGTIGILNIQGTYYGKIVHMDYLPSVTTGGQPNILVKAPYFSTGKQLAFCDSNYNMSITQGQLGLCMNPEYYIDNIQFSNKGGWNRCSANKSQMDQFLSALPTELQAVISNAAIYTDNVGNATGNVASNVTQTNNKVFYLSEFDVFGTITYGNTYEANFQQQLKAYANGMNKIHYKHDDQNTVVCVWLRSLCVAYAANFVIMDVGGSFNSNPCYSRGAAPCFMIA